MVTILKPFGQTLGVQATCASKCKHFVSKGMYVECTQTQERKRELGSMHAIVHAVKGTHARNFRRWKPRLASCGTVACVAASSATPGTGTFSHRSSARAQKSRTGQDGRLWKAVEGCGRLWSGPMGRDQRQARSTDDVCVASPGLDRPLAWLPACWPLATPRAQSSPAATRKPPREWREERAEAPAQLGVRGVAGC